MFGTFLGQLVMTAACYRLNVCVPQIHVLKPYNPQWDGV